MLLISLVLSVSQASNSVASRNGIERPNNSFAVGFTFSANGISDLCSGALISPTFIATAAHCVTDLTGKFYSDFIFTAPGTKLDDPINPATQPKVLKIYVPDGYYKTESSEAHDIAFIQLDKPLASKGYIRIATEKEVSEIPAASKLRGYGFGTVYETGEPYSVVAREYELLWEKPLQNSLQTFELDSRDSVACSGDSGGPITTTLGSGEEILVGTLHSAALVVNRCGTLAPNGLFHMQVTLLTGHTQLIDAELKKSLAIPTPTPTPTVKPKIYKITCVKGKVKKYISGAKPKCPVGYKQTAKVLISK